MHKEEPVLSKLIIGVPALLIVYICAAMGNTLEALTPTPQPQVEVSNFLPLSGRTTQPAGHYFFCFRHPGDCNQVGDPNLRVKYDTKIMEDIESVNRQVNESVMTMNDIDQYGEEDYWEYPHGRGDCEDYALLKRRKLIQLGWPPSTVVIATVTDTEGKGHAVLIARTSSGDMVMDNLTRETNYWRDVPYHFKKMVSPENSGKWVSISDTRAVLASR